MNLLELIESSATRLSEAGVHYGHGTTNARDEAAWLVLWSLGLPLDTELEGLDSRESRPISASELEACATLIATRIASRKPAAYLTHEAWLQGISFYVDERVIVPRSLIAELLVDGALDYWLSQDTHAVLDLCTGNGSLGVIAAMVYPEVGVIGADISADALEVARINVAQHELQHRIRLIESDGLTSVDGSYDLILCNPPYVNAQSMTNLPPEYRAEPVLALAGGSDGMDFIRRLLREAPAHMSENGVLVLEIGNERDNFEAAFAPVEAVWLETSAGADQVLLLTRQALLELH